MPTPQPIAFMSYVRFDDEHDNGGLTIFRERLSAEVRVQTGADFPIFQDRNDILWGQRWKERIEESVDGVTFFIPVVTPSFFTSPACRDELERFLEREKKLIRNDLVLPVYYVGCPVLDDEAKRAADQLAQAIGAHQWADWRDLRFEPFTDPNVGKTLAGLAVQIRDSLDRAPLKPTAKQASRSRARSGRPGATAKPLDALITESDSAEPAVESGEHSPGSQVKTEPPTHVVDAMHRGDYVTITEAIKAANPGDRILVRPWLYQEGLVVDKPLEIMGEGNLNEIVVQSTGQSTLIFKTAMGRVTNLTLRPIGDGAFHGVEIIQGRLELEGCDITGHIRPCVVIHGAADPRLRRNRIHDSKQGGVWVYDNARGTLEDNEIFGNAFSGVEIKTGSNPTLRRNRIHDCEAGVVVHDNGQGTLEDNDIFGNTVGGVAILTGSNPMLRRNRIHGGKESGVHVYDNGQGTLEDNDIFGNVYSGVSISEGGNPTLRRNRINNNGLQAVSVYNKGAGTFEDNDLRHNDRGAWDISADSKANVKRARNVEKDTP